MATFNFSVPEIDLSRINENSYAKSIKNQLMLMEENLRYMFSNLDEDNMSNQYNGIISNLVQGNTDNYTLIKQTADKVELKASKGELESAIEVVAGEIDLKVSYNDIIAAINLAPGEAKILANKITLTGLVKVTDLAGTGTVEINAGNLKAGGTIEGVTLKTTGIEITNSQVKLTRGYGNIVDSSGNPIITVSSGGSIYLGAYDNYANDIRLYGKNIYLSTNTSSDVIQLSGLNCDLNLSTNLVQLRTNSSSGVARIVGQTTELSGATIRLIGGTDVIFKKGSSGTEYSLFDLLMPTKLYNNSLSKGIVITGDAVVRDGSSPLDIGTSSNPMSSMYTNNFRMMNSAGVFGVFGSSATKRSIADLSTSATLAQAITKINEFKTAFAAYGFL